MKLNNYLTQLKSDSLKGKEDICLYNCSSIIKEVYYNIKEIKKKNAIKFIESSLNIPYPTLYCWVSGSNPIPISKAIDLLNLWRGVCNKSNKEFSQKIEKLYKNVGGYSQNGQRKVILPKDINLNLGYIIGFFQGDGHLKKASKNSFSEYSIYFYEANKEMINKLNELMNMEFGIFGNIYSGTDIKGSWFTLRFSSKPIYLFFKNVLGLRSGKKVGKIDVPKIIKNSPLSIRLSFIKGFFDAEGGVGETIKNPWLEVGQASKKYPSEILYWIRDELLKQNIIFSDPQKTSNQEFFRLRVSKRETIKRFYAIIGSEHPKKTNMFKEIITKCNRE